MKVFLSSVIVGLEEFRDAADRASRTLGHEVIRAEQFGASPATPQRTCLAGVRDADLVVLILGSSYGSLQDSGLSATHEEYMEARDEKQVLVFVCAGEMEERQQHLLQEVREWSSGHYTATFNTTEEFAEKVTRALHDHELSTATGPVDESEVIARAMELIRTDRSLGAETSLRIAVAGGPRQQVLRPAELEDAELRRDLMREGTYGDCAVLDPAQGTSVNLEGSSLAISQDSRSVVLDELGEVAVTLPACVPDPGGFASLPVLIEEDVAHAVQQGLRFCDWVLDRVDPLRRMSDVAVVATIAGGGHIGWRTREEQSANPNSYSVSPTHERIPVHLEPPLRKRAALTHDLVRMVEDFTILLRRQCR